MEFVE